MTKSRVQINRSSVTRQRPVDRDPGELYVNFSDLQLGVANPSRVATDLVAVRFHSEGASYVEDEFVVYNGAIYRAVAPSLPGPFVIGNWLAVSSNVVYWDDVQSKPATFPPTLPILQTDVIGLPDELAGKLEDAPSDGEQYARQDAGWAVVTGGGGTSDWADITGKPATFPPTLPIAQSGVTNLETDLAGKLPLAGGTMTGQLLVSGSQAAPGLAVGAADSGIYGTTTVNIGLGGSAKLSIANGNTTSFGNKIVGIVGTTTRASFNVPHGVAPTTPTNGDMWSTSVGFFVQVNSVTYQLATLTDLAAKANLAGATFTGKVTAPPATSGAAGLNIGTTGGVPSSPVDGDIWAAAGVVNVRGPSSTIALVSLAATQTISGTKTFSASPILPTPTAADNSTKGATTAYVDAADALKQKVISIGTTAPASPATNDLWLDIN